MFMPAINNLAKSRLLEFVWPTVHITFVFTVRVISSTGAL